MTRNEIIRRFPYASKAFLQLNAPPELQNPQPQRNPGKTPPLSDGRKETGPSLPPIRVRILSRRRRLLDPDNLHVKALVDALRYARLIPDDSAAHIELSVDQEKVFLALEEMTIVQLSIL